MKKTGYFLYYWLPPLLWMGFLFPSNETLTHESTSRFLVPLLTWLLPHADRITIELAHIAIRKSVHFFEYGLLAFLLLRAFRGGSRAWKLEWVVYSGIISLAYAALDESMQAFLPLRTGQFSDWMINAAGVFCTLGFISLKFRMVAGVKEPG
ncbi:MAG: VanZ family protein [Nitrospira sp.]|nr:VanZ family protein [Nitrospira sp.]